MRVFKSFLDSKDLKKTVEEYENCAQLEDREFYDSNMLEDSCDQEEL